MLAHLSHQAQNPEYRFKRLFRNLYNPLFYEMFFTSTDDSIRQQLPAFISELQAGNYRPKVYHYCNRFDWIVSQMVTTILSAIFIETTKVTNVHPKIFTPFLSTTWLFSGQIVQRDTELTLHFLKEKVADKKFVALVQQLEMSGYLRPFLLQLVSIKIDKKIAQRFPELVYVRVKESILVGANSTKQMALTHQRAVVKMVEEQVDFCLNVKGKNLYHHKERIPFRQYSLQLCPPSNYPTFFIEKANLISQLQRYRVVRIGEKGKLIAIHRPYLLNFGERDIIALYRRDFRKIANHYRYAVNHHLLKMCHRYMKESMLKTMAYKDKTTVKKVAKSLRDYRLDKSLIHQKENNLF